MRIVSLPTSGTTTSGSSSSTIASSARKWRTVRSTHLASGRPSHGQSVFHTSRIVGRS